MAINPITGPAGIGGVSGAQVTGAQPARPAPKSTFSELLEKSVGSADQMQNRSAAAIKDYLSGRTSEVLPAVSAVADADMSFKLLIGVRNKVIEAYKQTMNMNL